MAIARRYQEFKPNFNKGVYDPVDSLALALASDAIYKSGDMVGQILSSWQFANYEFLDVTKGNDIDTQCFIAARRSVVLIGFRGSEGKMADWLCNIQTVTDPGPFENTKVHEGFQDALFPVVMRLTYILKQYQRTNRQIWVTGHSLGGALACLFSAMLLEHDLPLAGVYTFAAPRVGSKGFAAAMDKAAEQKGVFNARVVNEGDAVPHIPPEPWFSHAGQRILLSHDGEQSESAETWRGFKHEISDWFSKVKRKINIADAHRLTPKTGYIPRLRRNLED